MAEAVVVLDLNGEIAMCNESAESILGLTRDQLAGRTPLDPRWQAVHEDGTPFAGDAHPAMVTLRTGQPQNGVIMGIRKPGGTLTWISVNSRPVLQEGVPQGVAATFADVTERILAQRAREVTAEHLRLALEISRNGIWDRNLETGESLVSANWKRVLGFQDDEIGSGWDDWIDRVHPEDRDAVLAAVQDHFSGKSPIYESEHRLQCKDGSWKWVFARGLVTSRDAAGKALQFAGAFSDISERKSLELARQRAEAQYREIFDGAIDGIYRTTPEGRMLAANLSLVRMYGFDSCEEYVAAVTDSGHQLWVDPAERVRFVEALEEQGTVRGYEGQLRRKDGTIIWCSTDSHKVCGPDGKTLYYEGFVRDITEQKLAEQALRDSEERFRAFVEQAADALFVHDFSGRFLVVNQQACQSLGYAREELLRLSVPDIEMDFDLAKAQATWSRIEPGQTFTLMGHQRRKDGTIFPVEVRFGCFDLHRERCYLGLVRDVSERERVDSAIREAIEFNRQVIDSAREGIIVYGPDLRYRVWNPFMEALAGVPAKDVLGRHPLEVFPFLRDVGVVARLEDVLAGGEPEAIDFAYSLPSGHSGWASDLSGPLRDEAGKIVGVIATVRDITEQKESEEALRESELRLRSVGDNLPECAIFRYCQPAEGAGRYEFFSAGIENLTGVPVTEVLLDADAVDRTILPEDMVRVRAAQAESFRRLSRFEIEVRVKHRVTGEERWSLLRSAPTRRADGSTVWDGIQFDITELKRAERALRESRAKLDVALASMTDAVCISDSEGRLLDFNEAYFTFHKFRNRAECPGTLAEQRQLIDVFLLDGRRAPFEQRAIPRALRGETVSNAEYRLARKDTGETWFGSYSFGPIRDKDGRIVGAVVVARDITEQKRAEEERARLSAQLAHSQKMESVGRLAGGVAHDFNNLLTVINGYSSMVMDTVRPGDPLRDQILEVLKAGEHAASLTKQLLAFSRRQILQPKTLNLNDVVTPMQSMLQRLLGEDIEIRFALCEEGASVNADQNQLEQVIMNLAVNARDAMPRGGRLLFETQLLDRDEGDAASGPELPSGRYAVLAVSDTGVGMDEETIQKIFEPFFTTKGVGEGTGLGLSMVQGIVAQSGGNIDVSSQMGKGTTFRIYLPAMAEKKPVVEKERAAVSAQASGETILVVEDNPAVGRFAATALKLYGYQVIQVADAKQALEVFERQGANIQLVLSDVVMPQMSGRELISKLKEQQPEVRYLFMSGYTGNAIAQHGVLAERTHFIEKPFSPEELVRKIREVLTA